MTALSSLKVLKYLIVCVFNKSNIINSFPPGHNGRHFTDEIFKCIFSKEKFCILIQISLKFVPKIPIDNNSALVQIMVCHLFDAKPLSESMLTQFTDAYMRH